MGKGSRNRRTVFGELVSMLKLYPGVRGTTRKLARTTIEILGHETFSVWGFSTAIVVTAGQSTISNPIGGCRRAEPAVAGEHGNMNATKDTRLLHKGAESGRR
jgi:hypothetical protein